MTEGSAPPYEPVTLSEGAGEIEREYGGWGRPTWAATLPAHAPELVRPPDDLPSELASALQAMGRSQLYSHQLATLEAVRSGADVLLVTSTASGKTLAFNLAVFDRLLRDGGTALYIYPLNALANDQRFVLEDLVGKLGPTSIRVGLVTGQASPDEKRAARAADVIATNPETLHYSILRNPHLWERALSNLRFIIVDEAHMYRGAFGAHMAHVVRRLLRLASARRSRPQIIAASATIGNPAQLASQLTGRDFVVIDHDGSAKAARQLVVWEAPTYGDGRRGPMETEALSLLRASLLTDRSVILFARTRRRVETLTAEAREALPRELAARVHPYRGGYTSSERKIVEAGLRSGDVRAVISTNALEVGIDIGSLDVAIVAGFPGSMMAFWQQAGRAGRRDKPAQIFFIPSDNPLDAYFAADPRRLVDTPHESATFDPWNPRVAADHVLWTAAEYPIRASGPWESPRAEKLVSRLTEAGALIRSNGSLIPSSNVDYQVSMRSIDGQPFRVLDGDGNKVAELDQAHIYNEAHPGAIYIHQMRAYRVHQLDEANRIVHVTGPEEWKTATSAVWQAKIEVLEELSTRTIGERGDWLVRLCRIEVVESFIEWVEVERRTRTQVRAGTIDPPLVRTKTTVGLLISPPSGVSSSAAHAVEHMLLGMVPVEVICDRSDFVGLTYGEDDMTIALFDRHPDGLGFAERAYERIAEIARAAADRGRECDCLDGCPRCVQAPVCERFNHDLDKALATRALNGMFGVQLEERPDRPTRPAKAALPSPHMVARTVADDLVREDRSAAITAIERRIVEPVGGLVSDDGWASGDYRVGSIVRHAAFGQGVVDQVQSSFGSISVDVRFGHDRRKIFGGAGYLLVPNRGHSRGPPREPRTAS